MKKILVVDDDPDIVELIVTRLKANNYNVVFAYDGIRAVQSAIDENPDLIILDMKMPAGDGLSVFENLKKSSKTALTPVIFITAYANEAIEAKVLKLGAKDFIAKPFRAEELLEKIKNIPGFD